MTREEFETVVRSLNAKLTALRNKKAEEYAPGTDRLQNFKTAAEMNHETIPSAIWGMMSKHIVSLADMIRMEYRAKDDRRVPIIHTFELKEWEAKLFDAIIYLQLLYAALKEDKDE